jgi:hypothetical protein
LGQLKSKMVRRKIIVVVKGVLGCPEEMLRILLL